MKLKAFTMAELLITMGIIAVVAALVLPGLFGAKPNKEMVMFRKAYYITSRIVNELINDEEYYPDTGDANHVGFKHTSLTETESAENEPTIRGVTASGNSKFCILFGSKLNLMIQDTIAEACSSEKTLAEGGNFKSSDGMIWSVPSGNAGKFETTGIIDVDVNGDAEPNCMWCDSPDQFRIEVEPDGRINVPEPVAREYLSSSNLNKSYSEIRAELDKKISTKD